MTVSPEFVEALESSDPLRLRDAVSALLESQYGGDRQALLSDLEAFRVELPRLGYESAEDDILDAMDFVTGWCSPHMKV
jgi:hypothetical protein